MITMVYNVDQKSVCQRIEDARSLRRRAAGRAPLGLRNPCAACYSSPRVSAAMGCASSQRRIIREAVERHICAWQEDECRPDRIVREFFGIMGSDTAEGIRESLLNCLPIKRPLTRQTSATAARRLPRRRLSRRRVKSMSRTASPWWVACMGVLLGDVPLGPSSSGGNRCNVNSRVPSAHRASLPLHSLCKNVPDLLPALCGPPLIGQCNEAHVLCIPRYRYRRRLAPLSPSAPRHPPARPSGPYLVYPGTARTTASKETR